MGLVEVGVSIVAVDPGVTCGLAVWDGIDQKLFWDQVPVNTVDRGTVHAKGRLGHGTVSRKASEILWCMQQEEQMAHHIADIMTALGPLGVLVSEDFILGWGGGKGGGRSSKREGLSPVRLNTAIYMACSERGLFNGDAWRRWRRMDMGGQDRRGVLVGRRWVGYGSKAHRRLSLGDGLVERVGLVRAWLAQGGDIQDPEEGRLWDGGGWTLKMSAPSAKAVANDERMKAADLFIKGKPHATDALRHMWLVARELGVALPTAQESLNQGFQSLRKSDSEVSDRTLSN